MGFMNKLEFWKRKDDTGLKELKKDLTDTNTGIKEEAMRPDFQPQNSQVTNLGLRELNEQRTNPNNPNAGFNNSNYNPNPGYNRNYGYPNNQNYASQDYNRNEVVNKSLEVVSAKLDAIKIAIDNINQRLNNIEEKLRNRW